jgi:hypothetical protein
MVLLCRFPFSISRDGYWRLKFEWFESLIACDTFGRLWPVSLGPSICYSILKRGFNSITLLTTSPLCSVRMEVNSRVIESLMDHYTIRSANLATERSCYPWETRELWGSRGESFISLTALKCFVLREALVGYQCVTIRDTFSSSMQITCCF